MHIEIRKIAFNPWSELNQYEHSGNHKIGACASFVGTMRDFNEGSKVTRMNLEYYPGMTEKQLKQIIQTQCTEHHLDDALIIHRVGEIHPGEAIVLIAAWSTHRKQAFDACRSIMEELKHNAPFWKKEVTRQGERWVEKNTAG